MIIRDLVKYRNTWIGVAMIWIILHHSGMRFGFSPLDLWMNMGYGGVDICLFASGLGCYTSLNKDEDIARFIKRRINRLFPTYILFILVWLIGKVIREGVSFPLIVGNLLGIQYFTAQHGEFNWYIGALLLFYFFAPYFKIILDRYDIRGVVLTLGGMILCSIAFWGSDVFMITVTRFPVFFMGMFLGKLCTDSNRRMTRENAICLVAVMLTGVSAFVLCMRYYGEYRYLWSYGLSWYPFILITPGLCMCISLCMTMIEHIRLLSWMKNILDIIGRNSFELYLIHIPLTVVLKDYIEKNFEAHQNAIWLMFFTAIPVLCYFFKVYVKFVLKIVKKAYMH